MNVPKPTSQIILTCKSGSHDVSIGETRAEKTNAQPWEVALKAFASAVVAPLSACMLAMTGSAVLSQSDSVADFYRGKQITMLIATSPGGDYDLRGRMLARYMDRHIPGNPVLIPRNMPGGVGLQAANWLYSIAPKDGTVLHMIMQNMPMQQILGGQGVQFDAAKFIWIGNTTDTPNTIVSWHKTGIRTIEDVQQRELIVGAPGTATPSVYFPVVMNALLGTKFKIIAGYPGGNDVNLAMERGEVGGRASVPMSSLQPDWIAEKKIYVLTQVGLTKDPTLPDVPLLVDLARNEHDRKVLHFMSADSAFARAVVTTPGVPAERVAALRKAFDTTMLDPQVVDESRRGRRDLSPVPGEVVQKIVEELLQTPRDVVERTQGLLSHSGSVGLVK